MGQVHDSDDDVRRAQRGDVRAFERLIAAHIAQIRRFARAFTHNDADADDLAQEALVKVYRAIGSYRLDASFSTWLYAVVRNSFLDHRKSRAGRERAVEAPLVARAVEAAGSEDAPDLADAQLQAAQERSRLWAAIASVPEDFRTAVVLFDIEGLSYEEIAAVEGVPLGTVKSRIKRGRDHLRALLTPARSSSGNLPVMDLVTTGREPAR
jgi:RNA polymerase sigma-70 factor (ECF subfamily)